MHTAQHIFSAIANDMYKAETVGNQISENNTRIDFGSTEIYLTLKYHCK